MSKQARDKGGSISCPGVDSTEKANSYANYVYPNNQHMYLKPRYVLLTIQCNPVDGFSVPHFRCLLLQCNMCPRYCIHQEEMEIKFDGQRTDYYIVVCPSTTDIS